MFFSVDTLSLIFEILFYVGLFCSILMFLFGHILDIGDLDSNADVGGLDTHISGNTVVSPFKPIIVLSFITVLGGTGTLLIKNNYYPVIATLLSLLLAIFIASLLYRFFLVPLDRAGQKSFAVTQEELIGKKGTIILAIRDDKLGSVTYVVKDNTYTSPAYSWNGNSIAEGLQVEIISILDNKLIVKSIN